MKIPTFDEIAKISPATAIVIVIAGVSGYAVHYIDQKHISSLKEQIAASEDVDRDHVHSLKEQIEATEDVDRDHVEALKEQIRVLEELVEYYQDKENDK